MYKEMTKLVAFWIVVTLIVMAIGYALMPVQKKVERAVMVNSHQYIEGMEQRARILEANITEIDVMLASNPSNADELRAQRRVLKARLEATIK